VGSYKQDQCIPGQKSAHWNLLLHKFLLHKIYN
jgi:hypothetical protein